MCRLTFIMYCICGACWEVIVVDLMHTFTLHLYDMRSCEVWVDNELDEGFNEAPQPIVTIRLSYICSNDQHSSCCNVQWYDIDHTIKTAASPHSLPASRTHIDIYWYLYIYSTYIYTYSYVCIHNRSMYILYKYINIYTHIYVYICSRFYLREHWHP